MKERRDNYRIQVAQAKQLFLTYDQQELIRRCRLEHDDTYFYTKLLGQPFRIHRRSGDMQRLQNGLWVDGNSFAEVMTVLDWLCDSKTDRFITGRWINVVTHGHYFHGNLQEKEADPLAALADTRPEAFCAACVALGGERMDGADLSFAIELLDGLRILVQLWHGDEEYPARLRYLWDENTAKYLRYETTWYALGLLQRMLKEHMDQGEKDAVST